MSIRRNFGNKPLINKFEKKSSGSKPLLKRISPQEFNERLNGKGAVRRESTVQPPITAAIVIRRNSAFDGWLPGQAGHTSVTDSNNFDLEIGVNYNSEVKGVGSSNILGDDVFEVTDIGVANTFLKSMKKNLQVAESNYNFTKAVKATVWERIKALFTLGASRKLSPEGYNKHSFNKMVARSVVDLAKLHNVTIQDKSDKPGEKENVHSDFCDSFVMRHLQSSWLIEQHDVMKPLYDELKFPENVSKHIGLNRRQQIGMSTKLSDKCKPEGGEGLNFKKILTAVENLPKEQRQAIFNSMPPEIRFKKNMLPADRLRTWKKTVLS
ncbi:hypothetical protein DID76_01490 [Candidatus Marinamargulisbacteria bacterium SCGC AG-414-C22]|nr:hypothetical protein DID76_01490 [Candidatus Marinamargulisbacteria bacterium SCGC AG-414-C22]